ncbi:MAG: transcriptional regulator [Rikenellaceae bacterium]
MKKNDKVLISPDLTNLKEWLEGVVIEIEDNSFVGCVITAKTEAGEVYFGKEAQFKLLKL